MSEMSRVALRVEPSTPRAGERFLLVVELVEGPEQEKLIVTFEKHRIYLDQSGGRALCPILGGYFEEGSLDPAEIAPGSVVGTSYVQVRADARNPPCPDPGDGIERPVQFPDGLMFTAFVKRDGGSTAPGRLNVYTAVTVYPARPKTP
jgi:hypothetical protein